MIAHRHNIIPAGVINSTNRRFVLPEACLVNTLRVMKNGVIEPTENFAIISPSEFEMNEPPLTDVQTVENNLMISPTEELLISPTGALGIGPDSEVGVGVAFVDGITCSYDVTSATVYPSNAEILHKNRGYPKGYIDGINKRYLTPGQFIPTTLRVRKNGLVEPTSYMTELPPSEFELDIPPLEGDTLEVDFDSWARR